MKLVTEQDTAAQASEAERCKTIKELQERLQSLYLIAREKEDAVQAALKFVTQNPAHFRDLNGGTPDLEVQLDLAYSSILAFFTRKDLEKESGVMKTIAEVQSKLQQLTSLEMRRKPQPPASASVEHYLR